MNEEDQIHAVEVIVDALNSIGLEISRLRGDIQRNSGYHARNEIEQIKQRIKDQPKRLEHFGFKVYSQHDEDGIIEEIFRRLNIAAGTFCEIGVEDGLECNSLYLIHKGWRGAWLEGNIDQKQNIEGNFHSLINSRRLSVGVGMVTPDNIGEAIDSTMSAIQINPEELDFLSIDIDGMDIYLFEALNYRPKVICIEYNGKFPASLIKKPIFDSDYAWKGGDYMGASLAAMSETAMSKGYTLVGTNITGVNAFFVRSDLVGASFEGPFTSEALFNPARYSLFFDHFRVGIGHKADFGPYVDLI